ncbi:alpha/beta fold hydrolase [Streptomyces sp. NPDC007896]|uniref:alpha/beta fold hydrolase n=1 Tax=Streptomyces sp. NPDC007896 TaxID=3364784 RepID=UPI0036EFA8E7
MPHVSTTNAARDMDLLRHVLGDHKLHYFGTSYGTHLGATYAHLFPGHVGRAVFDAVVDPTQDPVQQSLAQTRGFQLALDKADRARLVVKLWLMRRPDLVFTGRGARQQTAAEAGRASCTNAHRRSGKASRGCPARMSWTATSVRAVRGEAVERL